MSIPSALLTFERLAEVAVQKREKAKSPPKIRGWSRVLETLEQLVGGDHDEGLVTGDPWFLAEVRIENYQGVTTMEPLVIEPTPGITVLHGPNGSGKSSIAEAVETALRGTPRGHGARRTSLWDRSHCARGADSAEVEVVLRRGEEMLTLSVGLDTDGVLRTRTAVHRCQGHDVEIALDRTPWGSALAGFRPIVGYAEVERQVQRIGDLQKFLEPMLRLGGCFQTLKDALDTNAEATTAAFERWRGALATARRAVEEVDIAHGYSIPEIEWPGIDADPDEWLVSCGLSETGDHVEPVTLDHGRRLSVAVDAAVEALVVLEANERTVLAKLARPLRDLSLLASQLDHASERCPVCATHAPDWSRSLAHAVEDLESVDSLETVFATRLRTLYDTMNDDLAAIGKVVDQEWFDTATTERSQQVRRPAGELWKWLRRGEYRSTPDVRRLVREVAGVVNSETWVSVVESAAERSDGRRQWLRARRAAVESFVEVWRTEGSVGASADEWRAASSDCLSELQNTLRKERAGGLRDRAGDTMSRLLFDVDLEIKDVSVQAVQAKIQVEDGTGSPVELSMLSAGQRNALLLSPLLSVTAEGPFGFLVLDDPVHAFDRMRVDHLARTIAEVASRRRVVVFTHDDRLKEHLLVMSPEHVAHEVSRDPESGAVRHDPARPLWRVLLDDALAATQRAEDSRVGATVPPCDLIRSFCRMAVDAALRQFVMLAAHRSGRDVVGDLDALDRPLTTEKRFIKARRLYPGVNIERAWEVFRPRNSAWSRAVHGNSATSAIDLAEIDDARRVCTLLAAGFP